MSQDIKDGKQYDVVVQMEDDKRRQPNDLLIYVKGNNNNLVQLSNIVQLEETVLKNLIILISSNCDNKWKCGWIRTW